MKDEELHNLVNEAQKRLTELRLSHWIQHEVLTPQWWFLLVLFLGTWLLWWHLADKRRLFEIGFLGLLIAYLATLLDAAGTELQFWSYHYKLFPLYNRLMTADIALIPVCYMLLYQWFPGWKPFLLAHTVLALGASFAAEPLFMHLGIYQPILWKSYYSFPVYLLLASFTKGMMETVKKRYTKITAPGR
ncbi:CBO0543 family protein [Paenibacillus sp. S-38]|uniref:CBO0543 family protein n=1 Tax=Paenibacillus sp. S-38 TaxID=3416710 RepID=UPI003CF7F02F